MAEYPTLTKWEVTGARLDRFLFPGSRFAMRLFSIPFALAFALVVVAGERGGVSPPLANFHVPCYNHQLAPSTIASARINHRMSERWERRNAPRTGWRWAIWVGFLLLWSTALVVPDPIGFLRRNAPEGLELNDWTTFLMAKTLHVTAYACAAILTGWLRVPSPWRWALLAFWFLHADATEVAQLSVPG